MKKAIPVLALFILLTGCAGAPAQSSPQAGESANTSNTGKQTLPALESLPALEGPEGLDGLTPADFGCLTQNYPTTRSEYGVDPGGAGENTVVVLRAEKDGPTVFVVGGVHGDEVAGWYAAQLLQSTTLKAGTIYLLSPANSYGAQKQVRTTREGQDLNRAFPGDWQGNDTQRMARAIFDEIEDKAPSLVLDLHEAKHYTDGWDNLGNSVICQELAPVSDLVFALMEAPLASRPLDLYSTPPAGSLNQSVSQGLGLPVLTIETAREETLAQRVATQLRIVEFILEWNGMR